MTPARATTLLPPRQRSHRWRGLREIVPTRLGTAMVGVGAVGLGRIWAQALQLVLFLVAARVLSVADFGWFSLLFALATGLAVLAEGGWRELAIAAEDTRGALACHAPAWRDGLRWTIAGALALGAVAWAQPGAGGLPPATAAPLLLWVLLRPLAAVRAGLLTRRARLTMLAVVQALAETAACLAGVALLFTGAGLAALVWAKLAALAVELAGLALATREGWWAAALPAELAAMRRFSRQIRSARLLNYLQWNLATLLAGLAFAPVAVGLYRAAIRLAGLVQDVIGEPVRLYGWARLRQAADDRAGNALSTVALRFFDVTMTIACAPLLVLTLRAEQVVAAVLGAGWLGAAPLLRLLTLGAIARLVTMTTDPLLPLIGRADLTQRLARLTMVANALALVLALPFGIGGIAAAGLIAALAALVPALTMLVRDARLSAAALASAALPTVLGAAAACCANAALPSSATMPGLGGLGLASLSLLAAYALAQGLGRAMLPLIRARLAVRRPVSLPESPS